MIQPSWICCASVSPAGERRLIWLEGRELDCTARAEPLLGAVFWLGNGPDHHDRCLPPRRLQRLGQVRYPGLPNAFSGFHPDAFGALAGFCCGRAASLLLLTPPGRRGRPTRIRDRQGGWLPSRRMPDGPVRGSSPRLVRLLAGDPAPSGSCVQWQAWHPSMRAGHWEWIRPGLPPSTRCCTAIADDPWC